VTPIWVETGAVGVRRERTPTGLELSEDSLRS
jgi:hypothetical protein